jgi:cation transport ATPase
MFAILLITTLFGTLELASGLLGHETSALLVILNGMRLLNYKQSFLLSIS